MPTLLIKGGYLLQPDEPLVQADLLITNDAIAAVGDLTPPPGADVLDATGKVVIPGLINAHTHSNQSIEKGLCDKLPLDAWMVLASYGGAGARLEPRDLYVSALLGAIEMLSTGTTAVLDCNRTEPAWFDEGMDAVMQAYMDIGMRANVATQYADLDFFSSIPLGLIDAPESVMGRARRGNVNDSLDRAERFIDKWKDRHPLLTPMLGPSSVPRCSRDLFEGSLALARRKGVRLQTHLLSAKSQVPVAEERFSGSTVDYLRSLGGLQEWTSFAHGIWLSDEEVAVLGETDTGIVHNPVSNQKLGAGIAPAPALVRAGVNVALGSDGASSNDSQNMFETVKSAAILHRIANPPDSWPGAEDVLRMCWHGGAAVMGQRIGRIAPGCKADLTVLSTASLFLAPKEQLMNQIVYSELGMSVETVIVGGTVVVRNHKIQTIDVDAVLSEAQELAARVWASLPERFTRFEETEPLLRQLEERVGALELRFARTCG